MRDDGGVLAIARGSRSLPLALVDKRIVVGDVAVLAITLDVALARRMKAVDPEAIFFFDYLEESDPKAFELCFGHPTFKDGVLDSLSEVLADRSNVAESASASLGLRVDVVGD